MLGQIFEIGPKGKTILVDASGALIANDSGADQFLVYQFGPQGQPITVDASGRVHVNVSSPFIRIESPTASGSLDLSIRRNFDITLDKDVIYTGFGNPLDGTKYLFALQQDDTGSRTVTWPSNVKWRGGSAPTLTTTVSGIDVVTMIYRSRDNSFLADVGIDFQ